MTYPTIREAITAAKPHGRVDVYGLPEKDIDREWGSALCDSPIACLPDVEVVYHLDARQLSGIWYCEACGEVARPED